MSAANTLRNPTEPNAREEVLEDKGQESNGRPQDSNFENHCPVCGAVLKHEKCKVVCRSETCVYLIVFNCSEF